MNELRPLSVGEILDAALRVYRAAFPTLVGVAAVTIGVPTILLFVLIATAESPTTMVAAGAGIALLYLLGGLAATAAIIWVVSEAYLGARAGLWDSLAFALGKAWRVFVAGLAKWLIIGFAEFGLVLVGGAFAMLLPDSSALVAGIYGLTLVVAMLAVGILLTAAYAIVTQAVVLEPLDNATDALPRSWTLTKGARGRAVLLWVTIVVLITVPVLIAAALGFAFPGARVAFDVVGTLLQLVLYPVFSCVFTIYYYDLRVRKEAFDLEALSGQLEWAPDTR